METGMKRMAMMAMLAGLAACGPEEEVAQPTPPPAPPLEALPPAAPVTGTVITVDLTTASPPTVGVPLQSPLQIDGVAPARYFFEAVFPVRIESGDYQVIAEALAQAQEDWTNGNPTHPFRATLTFTVTQETAATLVFEEDMPELDDKGEGKPPKQVRVPVMLVPSN